MRGTFRGPFEMTFFMKAMAYCFQCCPLSEAKRRNFDSSEAKSDRPAFEYIDRSFEKRLLKVGFDWPRLSRAFVERCICLPLYYYTLQLYCHLFDDLDILTIIRVIVNFFLTHQRKRPDCKKNTVESLKNINNSMRCTPPESSHSPK